MHFVPLSRHDRKSEGIFNLTSLDGTGTMMSEFHCLIRPIHVLFALIFPICSSHVVWTAEFIGELDLEYVARLVDKDMNGLQQRNSAVCTSSWRMQICSCHVAENVWLHVPKALPAPFLTHACWTPHW